MAIQYADELQGPNIYQLESKTIYYNKLNKNAYIIKDKDAKQFTRLQSRTMISILATFIGLVIFRLTWESLLMGIALYTIITVYFYGSFLKKLNKFEGFSKEKYFDYLAYTPNVTRRILIYMLLVCLILLYIEYLIVY